MFQMRYDLQSLHRSHIDAVTPDGIAAAPVALESPSVSNTELNDTYQHNNRMDSSKWVLDISGQPIFIPPLTDGTRTSSIKV